MSDKAVGWNASADVNAPIFDSGSRQAQVTISESEKEAMVTEYRYAIQLAFKEVLDGLTQIQASEQQLQAQQRQVSALSRSLQLARKRFDAGYSSYLEVLDAQRQLFTAQLAQVTMQLNHSKAQVSLYKALGGHWQSSTEPHPAKS